MTVAVPILTQGTTVTFNAISIGGVKSMTGIGSGKSKAIDVTTLASTAMEYKQGLRDFGTLQIDVIRDQDDAGQAAVFTAQSTQSSETVVIVLSSSTVKTATFTAWVESMTADTKADDVVMGVITLRITGAVVWS